MLRYIRTLLEVDDYKVETASTGEEALQRVDKGMEPDLVLLDVLMPGIDGLETLEQLRQKRPGVKVVMLSCVNDTKKVVQAMRLGAQDYLTKPFQKAELDAVIDQCLGQGKTIVGGEVEEVGDDVFFIAASPAMRKIRSQAALVAHVDIPVLLLGESGTGKEVLARLIHKLSPRAHRTFLKVNCAAVPADLLESELFGYEPGAFTGATHAKPGKFELCNKGTILLDEIGEMPPALQAKLLHVLQDQRFSRLGSRSVIKVDVRILAATNIDIPQALATKRLREDLYYRLNAFTLQLPPLRERKEEIPILLKHFMTRMAERYARPQLPLSPALLEACQAHSWPGNLRELNNFLEALFNSGRRASGGGRIAAPPRWQRRRRRTRRFRDQKRRSGRRIEVTGPQRQGRSRRRSHPPGARADQLESQTRGRASADQLQSPALQDPAIRNRRSQEPPQAFRRSVGIGFRL